MALLARRLAAAVSLAALAAACPPSEPKTDPKVEADGLYLAGTSAYLQGQLDVALAHFNQVRALRPDDPRLPAAIGEVYLAQRQLPEALKEFQAAALADPKRATNWSRIGYIQSVLGQRDDARVSLKKALALNAQDFNALEELGELDLKDGNLDGAVGHWVLAAQASPDSGKGALYLRAGQALAQRGRAPDAIKLLEQARAMGVRAPELLVELGDQHVKAGQLPEAVAVYRQAAQLEPDDPTLWELVGELESRLQHLAEAEEAFRQSLKIKDRALPHVALARLSLSRKDKPKAEEELVRALAAANGEERRETLELADLLGTLGRKQDALKLLSNLAAEPDSARDGALQLRTARLARELGDHDLVKAACLRAADAGTRCP